MCSLKTEYPINPGALRSSRAGLGLAGDGNGRAESWLIERQTIKPQKCFDRFVNRKIHGG
jgi:hypothetical protein